MRKLIDNNNHDNNKRKRKLKKRGKITLTLPEYRENRETSVGRDYQDTLEYCEQSPRALARSMDELWKFR